MVLLLYFLNCVGGAFYYKSTQGGTHLRHIFLRGISLGLGLVVLFFIPIHFAFAVTTVSHSIVLDVTKLTNAQWEKQIEKTSHFMGPSDGAYPVLHKGEKIWIDAKLTQERIYIKNGKKTLYTMLTSSGLDTSRNNSTPRGTFYVQAEKGLSFFSRRVREGARYWTSWKNHGEFLFHSVPIDKKGNYIKTEEVKLGKKASHGCFRLTVSDAKWIYTHIPKGTKVVVHK
jgi:hypothetical protein